MSFDLVDVERAFFARLSTDATLDALVPDGDLSFQSHPSEGAAYPFVTWAHLGAGDIHVVGSERVLSRGPWLVRSWAADRDFASVEAIAERVDELLDNYATTVGGIGLHMRRESSVMTREEVDGSVVVAVGGTYRVWWYAT